MSDLDFALAFKAYCRQWYGFDGPYRHLISENGRIKPEWVRPIAIEYNVNRGIVADRNNANEIATRFAEELNSFVVDWPLSLSERAAKCLAFAKRLKDQSLTKTTQRSAVTKFAWFLRPEGWTVVDQLAFRGLMKKGSLLSDDSLLCFYNELENRNFPEVCRVISSQLFNLELEAIPAERIVDVLLMMRGEPDLRTREEELGSGFMRSLPPMCVEKFQAAADSLRNIEF